MAGRAMTRPLFAVLLALIGCTPTPSPAADNLPSMTISYPSAPFPFAPETNFPAGSDAWSSQPLKVAAGADYFTPGALIPAENVNQLLHERDTALQALIDQVNASPRILGVNELYVALAHTFSDSTLDTYVPADFDGILGQDNATTPFSSGVTAGDIIEIDFSYVASMAVGLVRDIRMFYSETATSFTTGTVGTDWFEVTPVAGMATRRLYNPSAVAQYAYPTWHFVITPSGSTGHLRFALGTAVPTGSTGVSLVTSTGSGRYRWLRSP